MKKHYLTQFTEYFGEDEVKRNYAHTVDDKYLKCKTDRQYIKWFYSQKPTADDLTKSKDLWWCKINMFVLIVPKKYQKQHIKY